MIKTAHFIRLTESPVGGSGEAAEGSDEEEEEGGRSIHVSSGPDSSSCHALKGHDAHRAEVHLPSR